VVGRDDRQDDKRDGALAKVARELGIGTESVFSSVRLRSCIGRHPGRRGALYGDPDASRRLAAGVSLRRQLGYLVVRLWLPAADIPCSGPYRSRVSTGTNGSLLPSGVRLPVAPVIAPPEAVTDEMT
jgi:hypothetical protein